MSKQKRADAVMNFQHASITRLWLLLMYNWTTFVFRDTSAALIKLIIGSCNHKNICILNYTGK